MPSNAGEEKEPRCCSPNGIILGQSQACPLRFSRLLSAPAPEYATLKGFIYAVTQSCNLVQVPINPPKSRALIIPIAFASLWVVPMLRLRVEQKCQYHRAANGVQQVKYRHHHRERSRVLITVYFQD